MSRTMPRAGGAHGTDAHRPIDRPPPITACGSKVPPAGQPPTPRTGLRVGPHNRCTHPTPPPPGRNHCRGDNGCAFRLPTGVDLCPEHAREARLTLTQLRTETALPLGLAPNELSTIDYGTQGWAA